MTLRGRIAMARLDRFCARLNDGLLAVAIVLAGVVGAAAIDHAAQALVAAAPGWFAPAPAKREPVVPVF
jgi:hypothetical protein